MGSTSKVARRRPTRLEVLLGISLLVLCIAVYGTSLTGFFSGTDTFSLIETGRVDELRDLGRILARPLMAGTGFPSIALYYRPLSSLSFGFDHWIWGLRPFGYALTNLLLHAANTLLVFLLLRTQGRLGLTAAWLGAAIFLLSPIMVEVVPVMSRRQDMLALLLGLLALLGYRAANQRTGGSQILRAGSVALFGLGLMAKEIAVVFAVLIPADRILVAPEERKATLEDLRQGLRDSLPYLVVLTLFLVLRFLVLGGMGGEQSHGGIVDPGGLGRALQISAEFFQELIDPSKALVSSGPTTWAPALFASIVLFGAAAGIARRRAEAPSGSRRGLLGWGSDNSAAAKVLLVAGCLCIGLGLAAAGSLPAAIEGEAVSGAGRVVVRGLVLGVGLAGLLLVTLRSSRLERSSLGRAQRSAYYGLWILIPLAIYMATGTYSGRAVYVPAVGVAATIAGLVDALPTAFAAPGARDLRHPSLIGWAGAGAVLLFLTGSMMLSSPAVKGLGEWPAKSRLAQSFFAEFESKIGQRGPCQQIVITGLPDRGTIGLEEYSVQSWLHLRYPGWDAQVNLDDRVAMTTIPADLKLRAGECRDGRLTAQIELP